MPLLIPPLVAGIAWSILGSPRTGIINVFLGMLGLDLQLNFYSSWGIIVIFGIYYAPYVYMFTSSALKNMDPALEEAAAIRSEEHTSELQSLMRISYAVFCLKKKKQTNKIQHKEQHPTQ